VSVYKTVQCHSLENHNHYHESLKTHILSVYFVICFLITKIETAWSWGNSMDIAMGLQDGQPGFDFWQEKMFLFFTASRLTLGPTQPPLQWILGAFSSVLKQLEHETDHSAPSSSKVKNG
jgi:hypothetical protein